MANLERNNKILFDLVRQPGNNVCADCGAPGEYPHKYFFSIKYVLFSIMIGLKVNDCVSVCVKTEIFNT